MNINYRAATLDDMEILLTYEQEMIRIERPMDVRLKRDEKIFYYDIKDLIMNKDSFLLVGEYEGKIIATGYAKIKKGDAKYTFETYGYLGFMLVAAEHRGKGINQSIIQQLIDWLRKRDIQEICLEVYENNPSAIRAYQKMGFAKQQILMRIE